MQSYSAFSTGMALGFGSVLSSTFPVLYRHQGSLQHIRPY